MQKIKLLTFILISLVATSCAQTEIAAPVFMESEKTTPKPAQKDKATATISTSQNKKKSNKSVGETAQTATKDEELESEVHLATITTDYTSKTYELVLSLNNQQQVTAIKTKSNKGKVKDYPLAVLDREIVLAKAVGISLVTLLCKDFSQENGCPIEIEYPSNLTYGKFLKFQAQLNSIEGRWQLQSGSRSFNSMHLVAKKFLGLLIGVERIELR